MTGDGTSRKSVIENLVLAAAYFLTAQAGLAISIDPGNVSAFWPPSGLALAALLVKGPRIVPALAVAEFCANLAAYDFSTGPRAALSLAAGLSMTAGMLLEALAGARLTRRFVGGAAPFDRLRDAVAFFAIAPPVSLIGATAGVASLSLASLVSPDAVPRTWLTWLIGDTLGIWIVAPLMLAWRGFALPKWPRAKWIEYASYLAVTGVFSAGIFLLWRPAPGGAFPLELLVLPLVTWGAFRFELREMTLTLLLLGVFALVGTMRQTGPYVAATELESQLHVQSFMGILALLSLTTSTVTARQRRAERALVVAKQLAEKSARAKAEFLDIAAHELRTPVAAFLLLVDLGRRQSAQGRAVDPALLDRVHEQVKRLARLVDDLLDVSRLERGLAAPRLESADLAAIVRDTIEKFRSAHPDRGIVFVEEPVPAGEAHSEFDPVQIGQVLGNLVDNAIKHTADDRPIEIRLGRSPRVVRVSVTDHGPGIPRDEQAEIFGMFTRGRADSAVRNPGLGLGLFVSESIVKLHGGVMGVDSEPGRGSTFFFELPRRAKAPP